MISIAAARQAYSDSSRAFRVWTGILGLLVLAGMYVAIRQTLEGHQLTNMSGGTGAPWGIYITGFVFFVGASAGSTIIGLMVHAFGREDFAPLATRAILVGLLSLVAAVLFIAMDVGRLERMFMVPFIWNNLTSMFFYTSTTYYIFGAMLIGELYYTIKLTKGNLDERGKKRAKWLAIAAVPFALMVLHAPHGALFAVIGAREFWNSGLLPPHFAGVAVLSGVAIMILVTIATSRLSGRELVSKRTLAHLGVLMAFFITLGGFFDFFDFLVNVYGDKPGAESVFHFLEGSHLIFSVLHVGGFIVALGILLTRTGRQTPRLTVAATITIVAVIAYRYNLTTTGLAVPLLPFLPETNYSPSGYELTLTVGIVALVSLAYLYLTKMLPMEESVGRKLTFTGHGSPARLEPETEAPPMRGADGPPAPLEQETEQGGGDPPARGPGGAQAP